MIRTAERNLETIVSYIGNMIDFINVLFSLNRKPRDL